MKIAITGASGKTGFRIVEEASKYVSINQLGVAPQCGLAQVAIAVGLITIMGIIAQWIMWRKKSTAK